MRAEYRGLLIAWTLWATSQITGESRSTDPTRGFKSERECAKEAKVLYQGGARNDGLAKGWALDVDFAGHTLRFRAADGRTLSFVYEWLRD